MSSEKIMQLRSENPEIRIKGIESFSDTDIDSESAEALCELITDRDKGVRNALLILFSGRSLPEIPVKIVPYIKSNELSVKNFAGELLVRIGSPAVDAMLEFIDDGDNDDKKFIIDLLGLIKEKKSTGKILKVLKTTWDSNTAIACIEALGNIWENSIEEPEIPGNNAPFSSNIEKMLKALMEYYSANELFRAVIIEAIGKIGQTVKYQTKIEIIEFLHAKFNLEDDLTRFLIVECLGKIGHEPSFYFLTEKLKVADGLLSREIVKSISSLKERLMINVNADERITAVILNTLAEGEREYKCSALNILPSIESNEVMTQCLKLLNGCGAVENLKEKFFNKPLLLYQASAKLLASGEAEPKSLLMLLYDLWKNFQEEMLKFKSSPGRMELINSIINCTGSPDEEIRMAALELLFIIDQTNSAYFLEEMADDPNLWNRLKIIDMLEKIPNPKAFKILAKLASDPEQMVSEKAKNILLLKNSAINIKDQEFDK